MHTELCSLSISISQLRQPGQDTVFRLDDIVAGDRIGIIFYISSRFCLGYLGYRTGQAAAAMGRKGNDLLAVETMAVQEGIR